MEKDKNRKLGRHVDDIVVIRICHLENTLAIASVCGVIQLYGEEALAIFDKPLAGTRPIASLLQESSFELNEFDKFCISARGTREQVTCLLRLR